MLFDCDSDGLGEIGMEIWIFNLSLVWGYFWDKFQCPGVARC